MSEHEIEEKMSGEVQRARKAFAFSVESILAKGGDGVRGDGGRNGTGAKRNHVMDEASLESKRAKLDELGKVYLLGCDTVKHLTKVFFIPRKTLMKNPGRARQNSRAKVGINCTKSGAHNKVDVCSVFNTYISDLGPLHRQLSLPHTVPVPTAASPTPPPGKKIP